MKTTSHECMLGSLNIMLTVLFIVSSWSISILSSVAFSTPRFCSMDLNYRDILLTVLLLLYYGVVLCLPDAQLGVVSQFLPLAFIICEVCHFIYAMCDVSAVFFSYWNAMSFILNSRCHFYCLCDILLLFIRCHLRFLCDVIYIIYPMSFTFSICDVIYVIFIMINCHAVSIYDPMSFVFIYQSRCHFIMPLCHAIFIDPINVRCLVLWV